MDLSKKLLLLYFTCNIVAIVQGSNNARDYFKTCLNLRDAWNQYHSEVAQTPSHPLQTATTNVENNVKKTTVEPCRSYRCLSHSPDLNLRKLGLFKCSNDYDCASDISAMVCQNFSGFGQNYCNCPDGYAFNTNECRCEPAELCWINSEPCHKGMKCQDQRCSCRQIETKLYEAHGGFCVAARSSHHGINYITRDKYQKDPAEGQGPAVVIVGLLAAFVILGLVAIAIYVLSVQQKGEIDLCARGDYDCENDEVIPGNRQNQPHVAAWDAPGMDFLSEEQTLKYINRSATMASTDVTKSPSMATTAELVDEAPSPSGSLPECEQQNSGPARRHINHHINESNYDNPTFSRNSSESTNPEDEVTKSSNML